MSSWATMYKSERNKHQNIKRPGNSTITQNYIEIVKIRLG